MRTAKTPLGRLFQKLAAWARVLLPVLLLAALLAFWRLRFTAGTLVTLGTFGAMLGAVMRVWRKFGAPKGDDVAIEVRPILLDPTARRWLYGLSALFFLLATISGTVQFKDPTVTQSVTILRLPEPDSLGRSGTAHKDLELTLEDRMVTDVMFIPPWGKDVHYRALGSAVIDVRVVPWRPRVLNHPVDFNPISLNVLVWPWFSSGGRLPVDISIESLDKINSSPILGSTRLNIAPASIAVLKYRPDPPSAADSIRWAARAQQLVPSFQAPDVLAGRLVANSVWIRTSRSLRPSERVRIVLRTADGMTALTRDTILNTRTTDVHFTKSPD